MTAAVATSAVAAPKPAAAESAVAGWLAARPGVCAEWAMLDGRRYLVVRRADDGLVDAARGLALLTAPSV